jgi:large subunit ribosomal protein L19
MSKIIDYIHDKYIYCDNHINFNTGDTITVNYEIKENDKIRLQAFKGVVISIKGFGKTKTFTVRKISYDIGVERIFVISQPSIRDIVINKKGKVCRSKIYYIRNLRGKKAKIKEKL